MTDGSAETGDWVDAARAALDRGTGDADPATTLVETGPPPVLDVLVGLTAVPLAGVAWAGAYFRELVAGQPLDPIALLLRALAFGLSIRALVALGQAVRRGTLWLRHRRFGLAVRDEGVVYRAPGRAQDVVVPRPDVLGVRERGDWRERSGARAAPVYLVHRPAGEAGGDGPWLALPPIFAGGPGLLAETLMRRVGRGGRRENDEDEDAPADAAPDGPLPSQAYDDAVAGRPGPGVIALRHGRRWWLRGPQATVLLGLAILDGFVRLPRTAQVELAPVALGSVVVATVVIPLLWLALAGRDVRARKGLSLVFTSSALLLRTRRGVLPIAYEGIRRTVVDARNTWSPFTGSTERRVLILDRDQAEGGPVRYDEAFLGAPAEVVVVLIAAYRQRTIDPTTPGVVA